MLNLKMSVMYGQTLSYPHCFMIDQRTGDQIAIKFDLPNLEDVRDRIAELHDLLYAKYVVLIYDSEKVKDDSTELGSFCCINLSDCKILDMTENIYGSISELEVRSDSHTNILS